MILMDLASRNNCRRLVKLGQSIRRDSQPQPGQQSPVAKCLTDDAVFQPTARIDMDRAGKQFDPPTPAAKFPHQKHVFYQSDLGKSADRLEGRTPDENPLIAVRHPPPSDSCGVAPFEPAEDSPVVVDPLLKRSADHFFIPKNGFDLPGRLRFQPAVGVQKQEHVTGRRSRSGVELSPATAFTGHDHRSGRPSQVTGSVLTLTISDDDLVRL